ncbi:MAG: hypothetical protein D6805_02920 [Planctomycetota bacterium]|nr:MAG: hypothetical protein D6805_02920 [Planctomycetota bacterium]
MGSTTPEIINNRYRVFKKLGEGGMGSVLLVEDMHNQNRKLALKKVLSQSGKSSIIEILRHEFEVLSQLRHPNIALAYDYGVIQGTNENYFTSEYVRGIDFYTGTKDRPLESILDLIVQCCRGFDYVHSRGLVHQDIKPDNILIAKDESSGGDIVKIIDFGLIDRENYKHGAIRGTPQFIAPEKLKGETVDRRADLYSFGIVIFFVLTRRLPFAAKSNKALILKHLYEDPPLLREVKPNLPEALEKIVSKLLQKDPSDRFMSAADIIRSINDLMGKAFPIDTDESAQSYILSGKFVGRNELMGGIRAIFDIIFKKFKAIAQLDPQKEERDSVRRLDAMLLGLEEKGESQKGGDKEESSRATFSFVLLGGDIGVGKTRLCREFRTYVQLNLVNFVEVFCSPESSSETMLSSILRKILPLAPSELLGVREYVQEIGKFVPEAFSEEELSAQEEELNPAEARLRMLERISRFLIEVSRTQPFVLYVDNLQWADELTIKALGYLGNLVYQELSSSSPPHILLLGCYRSGEIGGTPLEGFLERGREYLQKIELMPLDEGAMQELLFSMFGTRNLPTIFQERIQAEAKGNPLFLEELLKSLVETKQIWREAGEWEFPENLDTLRIPKTLSDILLSRLQRLDAYSRLLLQTLSILGKAVDPDLLARYLKQDIRKILDTLRDLEKRQIVKRHIEDEEVSYSFFHTSVQEAIYNSIDGELLLKLHRRAGEILEEYYRDSLEQYLPEIAHHYLKAGDREKGLEYGFRAAEILKNSYAIPEALQLLEMVVPYLGPADIRKKTQANLTIAALYEFMREYDKGIQRLQAVLDGPAKLNKLTRVQLTRKIAHLYMNKGELDRALELIDQTLSQIRNLGAPERGVCLGTRGQIFLRQAKLAQASEDLEEAIQILTTNERSADLIGVYNARGIVELSLGNWKGAREYFERCFEIAQRVGNQQAQGAAMSNISLAYLDGGEYERAQEALERAREIFSKIGDQKASVLVRYNQGELYWTLGRIKEGYQLALESYSLAEEMDDELLLAKSSCIFGIFAKARGRYDEAKGMLESAREFAQAAGDLRLYGLTLVRLGWFYTDIGRFSEAQAVLKEGLELAKKSGYRSLFALGARYQGLLLGRQGNLALAEKVYRMSIEEFKSLEMEFAYLQSQLFLAKTYAEAKDPIKSEEVLQPILPHLQEQDKFLCELLLLTANIRRLSGQAKDAVNILRQLLEKAQGLEYQEILVDSAYLLSLAVQSLQDPAKVQRYQKIAKQLILQLARTLPPEWQKDFYMLKRAQFS